MIRLIQYKLYTVDSPPTQPPTRRPTEQYQPIRKRHKIIFYLYFSWRPELRYIVLYIVNFVQLRCKENFYAQKSLYA